MSKFHKTAIIRKDFSLPVQQLLRKQRLTKQATILDYGCGRGHDVEFLKRTGFDVKGFDIKGDYEDYDVLDEQYDIIMCNFVLNVIEEPVERFNVEQIILFNLKKGGTAYIAVRNDRNVAEGYTSIGTWQGYVEPVSKKWELITENSGYKMWKYTK